MQKNLHPADGLADTKKSLELRHFMEHARLRRGMKWQGGPCPCAVDVMTNQALAAVNTSHSPNHPLSTQHCGHYDARPLHRTAIASLLSRKTKTAGGRSGRTSNVKTG